MNKTFEYTYGDVKDIGKYIIDMFWPINIVVASDNCEHCVTVTWSKCTAVDSGRPVGKISTQFNFKSNTFALEFVSLDSNLIQAAEALTKTYSGRPQLVAKYLAKIMMSNMDLDDLAGIIQTVNQVASNTGKEVIRQQIYDIISMTKLSDPQEEMPG